MRIQDPEAAPVLPALVVGLPRRRATGRLNAAETSLLRVLEDARPESKCQQGHATSKASRAEFFLPPPIPGCSLRFLACGHITPVSASVFTRTSFLHLCLLLFFIRTFVTEFKIYTSDPELSHPEFFNLILFAKTLFPNNVMFKVPRIRTWTCILEGAQFSTL